MSLDRRRFLSHVRNTAAAGLCLSETSLAAAPNEQDDEHFFVLIELKGGIHWMLATDGRDFDSLPIDDPLQCRLVKISEAPPTRDEYKDLLGEGFDPRRRRDHGPFIAVPYLEEHTDYRQSSRKGVTALGAPYVLHFSGFPLHDVVNDMAVVRGVRMLGGFHGGANNEIYSGRDGTNSQHVAGVLSSLLGQRYGSRILDNLVFEDAAYTEGVSLPTTQPIKITADAFARLINSGAGRTDPTGFDPLLKSTALANAFARAPGLAVDHRRSFLKYVASLGHLPELDRRLAGLGLSFADKEASLDLPLQLDTAMTLFRSGLSRVVTLCVGAPNDKNSVDGFGWFDAHRGLYHSSTSDDDRINTHRHHRNVETIMRGLRDMVAKLKATPFKNGKSMWDVTTVVVSSEFARPSNFSGNEASGRENDTAYGTGHHNYNNNYILFGKNVRGGAWVGGNDSVRQTAHKVDMESLATDDPTAVRMEPTRILESGQGEELFFYPEELADSGTLRPIMAKDLVRTIMAIAGLDQRYRDAYPSPFAADAKIIQPVVG